MLGVYVSDSLRVLWRLNSNLWGHLIISFVDVKEISSTYASKTNRQWRNDHTLVCWLVCALTLSNYRPMASPRRWQTSCQSFGCYDMRWGRPRIEGQNCVSDLQGTIAVTTEAHVRIRGSLSWWVSGETSVTHHMSHTPNTPAFICTDGGKIPEKCVKLVACMWEVGCFAFFELEWAINSCEVIKLRNKENIKCSDI